MPHLSELPWPNSIFLDRSRLNRVAIGMAGFGRRESGLADISIEFAPWDNCKGVTYPILVKSAPGNRERRQVVREAFQLQKIDASELFFVLGNRKSGRLLDFTDEIETHNDIIVGDFEEGWRNLPFKKGDSKSC